MLGFYTDGKKTPTMVRNVTETKVRVPGRRGKQAYKVVQSISNKFEIQDHYPVVAEPGGEYVTHVTPLGSTGKDISKEIVSVVRERGVNLQVLGMDGCSTNCGIHKGVFRCVEVELGKAVQHVVCLLHCNELFFRHVFEEVDGVTLGPDRLEGPIGSTLGENLWLEPVVNFKPVQGKMPTLPDPVFKELSRDQKLAYRWGHAIQTGDVPDDLVGQTIGPLCHSRWLTRGVRTLVKYSRTKNPTKKFQRVVFFILNFYLPGWFKVKSQPHIQDGARHLQFLLDLSRSLPAGDQVTVRRVMGDNAYFAHQENVAIACLSDGDEEVRRKGVKFILAARMEYEEDGDVRKFMAPEINFESSRFCDLIDLESVEKFEPPLTKELSEETILSALATPLILPSFPNNTQRGEQLVRVVTEAATLRADFHGRNRLILQRLKSRSLVGSFNSKMQDDATDG